MEKKGGRKKEEGGEGGRGFKKCHVVVPCVDASIHTLSFTCRAVVLRSTVG